MSSEWMEPLLLCGVYFTPTSGPQISSHSLEALPRVSTGKDRAGLSMKDRMTLSQEFLCLLSCAERMHIIKLKLKAMLVE